MLGNLRVLFFASLAGKFVYALSSVFLLPALVWMLGQESVGLLGFFTTMLMVFMALEGGLTSAITRQLATVNKVKIYAPRRYYYFVFSLTNTFLLLFFVLGLLVVGCIAASAHMLSTVWLTVEGLQVDQVQRAIVWMGVFIGLNFPIMLLQAAFQGRELHVLLNKLYVPYALLRTFGVLLGFYVFSEYANIELYFLLQALLQFLYALLLMFFYCKGAGFLGWWVRPSVRHVRQSVKFSGGVLMIALTSVVVVQIDKVYLSGQVSLAEYAVYALAGTFASVPYIVSSALYAALFPRFSIYFAQHDMVRIANIFQVSFTGFCALLVLTALAICFFSLYPLRLIFEVPLASAVSQLLPYLFIGTAFQALLIIPYSLQLAVGWTSLALRLNLFAIPVILLSLPLLVDTYGVSGAAWVWLSYNFVIFFLTLIFMLGRFSFLSSIFLSAFKIVCFLLAALVPFFYALQVWLLPGLSDVQAVLLLLICGGGLVALMGWCFRKDFSVFV